MPPGVLKLRQTLRAEGCQFHDQTDGTSVDRLTIVGEEAAHADSIAERIVQLGGMPDFSPNSLLERSHADYDESTDLKSMLRANLTAERIAVEAYRELIQFLGDRDPTTRTMLEAILAQEEEHADELRDLLKS